MLPRLTIEAFDACLALRSLRFEAVVVGGSALALLDVITRQTEDVDILYPELPVEVAQAAREFAAHMRGIGSVLADDWLNNGPIQLGTILPSGWRLRLRIAFEGAAIRLHTLGRADLLKMWSDHVRATLEDLGRRLGHGV